MPKWSIKVVVGVVSLLVSAGVVRWASARVSMPSHATPADHPATLFPDCNGAVIPPNIAPLNFVVRDKGVAYAARISSKQGTPIEVSGRSPAIRIPQGAWRKLLSQNRGEELRIEVFIEDSKSGQWLGFNPVVAQIAREDIDRYLAYRKMYTGHLQIRGPMRICYRDLTGFDEAVLLSSSGVGKACLNCHSFAHNHTDKMLVGLRSPQYGTATLAVDGDSVRRIEKKFGYTSWHPSGKLAAFSVNNLPMFYHTSRSEVRDTIDLDSMLSFYKSDTQAIVKIPQLARKDTLENWPAWSADGRFLYYCSAPRLWSDKSEYPPEQYDRVRYDLMRIAYDPNTDQWGQPETVLAAKDTGKSIATPHCSPDGRWLSFCMCDYGYFPAWQENSDIYLLDLKASGFPYRRLEINSNRSEGWQTWSSNSRWLVYSSKALNGTFTRQFISYVDSEGKAHKPIVLPQEDPAFYESCLQIYNNAELLTEAPRVTGEQLAGVFRQAGNIQRGSMTTGATPIATPGQTQRD